MLNTVEHVQNRNGDYYVAGSRVPIGVVIAAYKRGDAPERILEQFSVLTLADVYGAIPYYLDHQEALEAHFKALADEFERRRLEERAKNPGFYESLQKRIVEWRKTHPQVVDESGDPLSGTGA